jgi:hypothetical protein
MLGERMYAEPEERDGAVDGAEQPGEISQHSALSSEHSVVEIVVDGRLAIRIQNLVDHKGHEGTRREHAGRSTALPLRTQGLKPAFPMRLYGTTEVVP